MNLEVYKNNNIEIISPLEINSIEITNINKIFNIKVNTTSGSGLLYQNYTHKPIESNDKYLMIELAEDLSMLCNKYKPLRTELDSKFSECYMLNIETFLLKEGEIQ